VTTRTTFLAPVLSLALTGAVALVATKAVNAQMEQAQREDEERRLEITLETIGELFTLKQTDPELVSIRDNFIEDIHHSGALTDENRALISIVALATQQAFPQLKQITHQALELGVSPLVIRESVYLAAAFIGFPKTENAIAAVNGVFAQRNISLPLVEAGTVYQDARYEKGLSLQAPIYGNEIKDAMKGLPGNLGEDIPRFLTELLFGDFYTRKGLDLKTRELLSLSILATLGTEKQIRAHAIGNLKVGNDKATLIAAMVQCLPYIGFPYMFNAINAIRSVEWPDQQSSE
jgi:4-carboxymuconolactone decarboxylase